VVTSLLMAAAVAGALGSLHCAGMCGPLVLAGAARGGQVRASLLGEYLLGRLASYALVGAVMGQLGQHALCLLPVAAVQWVAVGALTVFCLGRAAQLLKLLPSGPGVPGPLRDAAAWLISLIPRRGLGLGLATGILPCGMLVPMWIASAGTGSPMLGAAVMAVFGAASAPGLLAPALAAAVRRRPFMLSPRIQAVAWALLAVWVALRPLLSAGHSH
jgi:sulfite exporter TauE/SafE